MEIIGSSKLPRVHVCNCMHKHTIQTTKALFTWISPLVLLLSTMHTAHPNRNHFRCTTDKTILRKGFRNVGRVSHMMLLISTYYSNINQHSVVVPLRWWIRLTKCNLGSCSLDISNMLVIFNRTAFKRKLTRNHHFSWVSPIWYTPFAMQ